MNVKAKTDTELYGKILIDAEIVIELINDPNSPIPTNYLDTLRDNFNEISFVMNESNLEKSMEFTQDLIKTLGMSGEIVPQQLFSMLRVINAVKDGRFASNKKMKPKFKESSLHISGTFALALYGDFPEKDKIAVCTKFIEVANEQSCFVYNVSDIKGRHSASVPIAENIFDKDTIRYEIVCHSPLIEAFSLRLIKQKVT